MMEWSDTGLVLHVGHFRESDLWLRVLTCQHGLVSVFAFGGSRSRRRFCGCLDVCNELQIRTKSTRNGRYLSLQEGLLLNGPRRLRTDRNRLGMFMNCVRFVETLGVPPDSSPHVFLDLKGLLHLLENAESLFPGLPVFFRLRLASGLGYAPAFSGCAACGRQSLDGASFLVPDGILMCASCAIKKDGIHGISFSARALEILQRVQGESPLDWDFCGKSGGAEESGDYRSCVRAIESFVQYHLGIVWENGRFRRH